MFASCGDADPLMNEAVKNVIQKIEADFGAKGRLVIRKSGTEPLVRVMGEGENEETVRRVVDDICAAIEKAI